ncbi:MAG: ATP-binding cassette domain-containing protein [Deltaproteobacteria bacterium]|nr:ATP-binding cassette domain-containing protein [Deltaproteobacteria bacterium]
MLELRDVSFAVSDIASDGVDQKKTIVDGISYIFETGKFYTITGPNGSGKTTLAKIIMGINQVTSGSIIFEGKDITNTGITDRARYGIAYGFQHPARFKGITFRDLLSIASGKDDEDELVKILVRCGICPVEFMGKVVDSNLSGGEIKKIELATMIARNPTIAIYDEPDTGIDLWTIDPMVRLLKREQKELNTTTIVVSHNKAFLNAADALILIKDGKIAYSGELDGAKSILDDLTECDYNEICEGELDASWIR